MEYKLIISGSPTDLEIIVNDLLKNGWEPHGDLKIIMYMPDNYPEYYQPMIKKPAKITKNHITPKFSTTSKAF